MKTILYTSSKILCIIFFIIYLMPSTPLFSQGASINTTGTTADPSAMLDISSNNSGLLIPRLTEAQKNAISSPATGLMIYQTDATTGFWYFNGSVWAQSMGPAGATGAIGATGTTGSTGLLSSGSTAGNTPYWDGSQWVVNSSNIYNNGNSVGIGTANPDASAAIDIYSTDKGALIPRITTTKRNAIATPAEGLIIYNLTTRCFETYINPMWQSIFCGCNIPSTPTAGTNTHTKTSVTWNWNTASGATGYKYNTVNNYNTATDNGTSTSFAQSGLVCSTAYTLYVWAYNNCGASTELTLNENTTSCFTCGVDDIVDSRDANTYQTVQIGTQCWMKSNLKYLPIVHSNSEFATQAANSQPGYGVYGYDGNDVTTAKSQANYTTYGVIYNWYAAMAGASSSNSNPSGVQGICLSGWHLPSDAEWQQLEIYLGMDPATANSTGWRGTDEGGKLKETGTSHWNTPNNGATNSSGFTALPGGYRQDINGTFNILGDYGLWFLATEDDGSNAWSSGLAYNGATVNRGLNGKGYGFAIRCLRD